MTQPCDSALDKREPRHYCDQHRAHHETGPARTLTVLLVQTPVVLLADGLAGLRAVGGGVKAIGALALFVPALLGAHPAVEAAKVMAVLAPRTWQSLQKLNAG